MVASSTPTNPAVAPIRCHRDRSGWRNDRTGHCRQLPTRTAPVKMWDWKCRSRGVWLSTLDGCNETVTAARNRLNKTRSGCRISECVSQLPDRRVNALIEVDKVALWPEALAYFFTAHNFAGPLEQHRKKAERLILKMKTLATLVELMLRQARLEGTKHNS